jgi:hypothetical protein
MENLADWGWLLVVAGGPALLGAAVLYGYLVSRRRSRREQATTEAATRELYRETEKQRTDAPGP